MLKLHSPSSLYSRMGGGTRFPQTSFTPILWTGDRAGLQAANSHPGEAGITPPKEGVVKLAFGYSLAQ